MDNDLIISFGSVNKYTFTALSDIQSVVVNSVGSEIEVKVLRDMTGGGRKVCKVLKLVPREWSGRGVLGCRIVEETF